MAVYIKKIGNGHVTPMNHARIIYGSLVENSTITASSTATGFTTDALKYPTTYEGWKADDVTSNLTFALGSVKPVSGVLIAGHNIGSVGASITVKAGAVQNNVTLTPTDDSPIIVLWDKATPIDTSEIEISITGGKPIISVVLVNNCLIMSRPIFNGHSPTELNRRITISNEKTISGQALGFTVRRQGASTSYAWSNIDKDFLYGEFNDFKDYAETGRGFFGIAWRPNFTANSTKPAAQYGAISGAISSSITGNPDYFDINLNVESAGPIK